jgi:DNA-binding MarR family transcriptional regulator
MRASAPPEAAVSPGAPSRPDLRGAGLPEPGPREPEPHEPQVPEPRGYEPREPEPDQALAELIDVARLRTALLRLSRRLRRHEVADLTPTQLSALATVARDGPLRLGDLAAAERIAPSTLTRLVSALEERGYVQRGAVPGDARACLLSVTEVGQVMLDKVRQETTSMLAASLRRLPGGELAALAAALPALESLADADPR